MVKPATTNGFVPLRQVLEDMTARGEMPTPQPTYRLEELELYTYDAGPSLEAA